MPDLLAHRDLVPHLCHAIHRQISDDDVWRLICGSHDVRPGANDSAVPPRLVRARGISGDGDARDEALRVEGARLEEQLPMGGTCGEVERARIEEHTAARLSQQHGEVGEAHIVADAQAHAAVGGVESRQRVSAGQRIALLERHAAWDVNVKEVDLSMLGDHLTIGAIYDAGIVDLASRVTLRDGACARERIERVGGRRRKWGDSVCTKVCTSARGIQIETDNSGWLRVDRSGDIPRHMRPQPAPSFQSDNEVAACFSYL